MASVYKLIGPNGATVEFVDTAGVMSMLLDGVQVAGAQGAAITSLTDSTTGTGDDTVVDVGASFSQATLNNNFADLIDKIEEILAALRTAGIIAT